MKCKLCNKPITSGHFLSFNNMNFHRDCIPTHDTQLDRIERMLRWIVVVLQTEFHFKGMTPEQKVKMEKIVKVCPDISDIIKEEE